MMPLTIDNNLGFNLCIVLQSQNLRVGHEKKSYIRVIQENLIEFPVQDYLLYIH